MGVGGVIVNYGGRIRLHGVDLVRVDGERGWRDGTNQGKFTLEIDEGDARENTSRRCVIDRRENALPLIALILVKPRMVGWVSLLFAFFVFGPELYVTAHF